MTNPDLLGLPADPILSKEKIMANYSEPMFWGERNCIKPEQIAETGYVSGDNPAAAHENYFRNQTYKCIKELQEGAVAHDDLLFYASSFVTKAGFCGPTSMCTCIGVEDCKVTVTGTGEISDVLGTSGAWVHYMCKQGVLTIPSGITRIGARIFYGCNLDLIYIPKSVTEIGEHAFALEGNQSFETVIRYGGTVAEYRAITKGSGWAEGRSCTVEYAG